MGIEPTSGHLHALSSLLVARVMNVTHLKGLTWALAVALTAGLFWYVLTFFLGVKTREQLFDGDKARELLNEDYTTEGPKVDVVALADVQRTFQQLNWTGKEAPPASPEPSPELPKELPKTPVADLIQVHFIQEDLDRPENSQAFFVYRDSAKLSSAPKTGLFLLPGDRLAEPHTYARVQSIDGDEGIITFVFDDESRPAESVQAPRFDVEGQIAPVGPDGPILPQQIALQAFDGPRPPVSRQTQLVGKDRFALGTEDMFLIADDYPAIVAREVRHRRHRDPKTGKYDGIELQEVQPGGTVSRHGGASGDIIKSINGHPVTSVSEAITFVKNNKEKYSSWEVVVENKGQERTVIYETPPSSQP